MADKQSTRDSAILLAEQTTPGVPEALNGATDSLYVENLQPTFDIGTITSSEANGTLDDNEGTEVTYVRGGYSFDVNITGEGAAGTDLRISRIMKACSWQTQITPASIGPTACQAGGSTTTAVLDVTASAVDNYYRGMPIVVGGNAPFDTPVLTQIVSYDGATKVATVASTLPGAPGVTETFEILPNVLYRPGSGTPAMLTMAVYEGDVKVVFEGCRGNAQLVMTTGGFVKLRVKLEGNFVGSSDEVSAFVEYARKSKIKFMAGVAQLDGKEIAISEASLDPQASTTFDPNPNQAQGFDAPEITGRNMQVTIDPNLALVATRNTLQNIQDNHEYILWCLAGKVTSGNRLGLVVPRGLNSGYGRGDRSSIRTEQLTLTAKGADAGAFISIF